jgi:hypothetical protein
MAEISQAGDHAILVTADRQYWVFVELLPHKYVGLLLNLGGRDVLRVYFLWRHPVTTQPLQVLKKDVQCKGADRSSVWFSI